MNVTDQIRMGQRDKAEAMLQRVDETATSKTGISMFHILTLGAIIGSIALFMSGKRLEAIFVGLWPPTFQALKSASENK